MARIIYAAKAPLQLGLFLPEKIEDDGEDGVTGIMAIIQKGGVDCIVSPGFRGITSIAGNYYTRQRQRKVLLFNMLQ